MKTEDTLCGFTDERGELCELRESHAWHICKDDPMERHSGPHKPYLQCHPFQPKRTEATFGDELKAFAAKLSDKLRDRAWDISSELGESDTTAALNILADEIDEVLHEGPNG